MRPSCLSSANTPMLNPLQLDPMANVLQAVLPILIQAIKIAIVLNQKVHCLGMTLIEPAWPMAMAPVLPVFIQRKK